MENICNEMEIILVAYECCCVAAVYPFAGSVRVQPTGAGTMRTGAHPKCRERSGGASSEVCSVKDVYANGILWIYHIVAEGHGRCPSIPFKAMGFPGHCRTTSGVHRQCNPQRVCRGGLRCSLESLRTVFRNICHVCANVFLSHGTVKNTEIGKEWAERN